MSIARAPLTPAELRSRVVITVPEYAATFSADERTVHRAIRNGQIHALRIGDTWRIPVAPLLQQCRLTPGDREGEPSSSPIASTPTRTNVIGRPDENG
jgi:excisionase family DNA binding protein